MIRTFDWLITASEKEKDKIRTALVCEKEKHFTIGDHEIQIKKDHVLLSGDDRKIIPARVPAEAMLRMLDGDYSDCSWIEFVGDETT